MPAKTYTKEERVWNFLQYGARQHVLKDLDTVEKQQIEKLSPEEQEKIKEQNRKDRKKAGIPEKIEILPEQDRKEELIRDDIRDLIIGNGSDNDLKEGFRILGQMVGKVIIEYGKETERVKSRLGESKYKDEKAALITSFSQNKATTLDEQVNTLRKEVLFKLTEKMSDDKTREYMNIFEKSAEEMRESLSPEDKKYFDMGYITKNFETYDHKPIPAFNSEELQNYAAVGGPARKHAKEREYENLGRAYKELTQEITPSTMANVARIDTKRIDTMFMRGIIKDMESTGTGKEEKKWYEKLWHKGNSKDYDNMMKNIKNYVSVVESNEPGQKIFLYHNKMVESLKKYVLDRATVRGHEFGQKRFDDAMLLLSQVLPGVEFDKQVVNKINEIRHENKDFGHDIDLKYYLNMKNSPSSNTELAQFRRLGLEGMDEIQKKTNENSTRIPSEFKEQWLDNVLEAVLSQNPKRTIEACDHFHRSGHNYMDDFKPIEDKFKAIGNYKYEEHLSDKDFIAIAYLASDGPVEYLTSERSEKHNVKEYAKGFEVGRQKAADAFRQYEAGNKEPLVHIIADGIKMLTYKYQDRKGLSSSLIAKNEMMTRAMKMMERDPELMRMAMDKNIGGLTKDDLANMRGVMRGAEVVSRGMDAKAKLDSHVDMTKEEKIKAYTDLETYTLMDYSMIGHHQDPNQFKGNKAFKQNYLMNRYKYNLGQALSSNKALGELRANVREIVKKNKMYDYSDVDRTRFDLRNRDFATRTLEFQDKSLGEIGEKMPQLLKKAPVKPAPAKHAAKNTTMNK
ncbi:hypothetical protein SAMN02910369_00729 [Lachnospiraceae bacterium NE2001]|nr:hypothetical protein SAMN02910369_00729 [Lachnospiraceae bacterium NE2001]